MKNILVSDSFLFCISTFTSSSLLSPLLPPSSFPPQAFIQEFLFFSVPSGLKICESLLKTLLIGLFKVVKKQDLTQNRSNWINLYLASYHVSLRRQSEWHLVHLEGQCGIQMSKTNMSSFLTKLLPIILVKSPLC